VPCTGLDGRLLDCSKPGVCVTAQPLSLGQVAEEGVPDEARLGESL
jgi:hypothetical protein